eukprot:scaffold313749_cov19-Prasinocladus_malaysianus.AAC.1
MELRGLASSAFKSLSVYTVKHPSFRYVSAHHRGPPITRGNAYSEGCLLVHRRVDISQHFHIRPRSNAKQIEIWQQTMDACEPIWSAVKCYYDDVC